VVSRLSRSLLLGIIADNLAVAVLRSAPRPRGAPHHSGVCHPLHHTKLPILITCALPVCGAGWLSHAPARSARPAPAHIRSSDQDHWRQPHPV